MTIFKDHSNEERFKQLATIYELRKTGFPDALARAEEMEAKILDPLPEPIEYEGQLIPSVDLMPVADFVDQVKHGCFIDYDGSGYYATEKEQSRLRAVPSEIAHGKINKVFTHVA